MTPRPRLLCLHGEITEDNVWYLHGDHFTLVLTVAGDFPSPIWFHDGTRAWLKDDFENMLGRRNRLIFDYPSAGDRP